MSFVVAITRWARPLEEELPALSQLLGGVAYDVRQKLAGPVPVIAASTDDPHAAGALLESIRGRGHGAVACDRQLVPTSSDMAQPADFHFTAEAFVGVVPGLGEVTLAYGEILALLWARHKATESETSTSRSRKFSAGRAILSGGLLVSKVTTTIKTSTVQEDQHVLYVYRRQSAEGGLANVLLTETGLRYAGLGEAKGLSRLESFRTTVEQLRQRAPEAIFDARLLTDPPRPSLLANSSTNVESTDLSAYLQLIAHLQNQV